MITLFFLSFLASSLTPKDIFCGEWDVHVGTSSEFEIGIKYSFEFHVNKSNKRTISTIWRSDIVSLNTPESKLEPMIAQFELSYQNSKANSDDFDGTIYYNEHSTNFVIQSLENNQLSTKINLDFQQIYVSLDIINNKTIEIAIGSLNNADNEAHFVAHRAQPVKLVNILPLFNDDKNSAETGNKVLEKFAHYDLPKSGAGFSDYIKYYLARGIQLFYRYKVQIYMVLFVIIIQVVLFMIIDCIKTLCSKGNNRQMTNKKAEQAKRKKNDDIKTPKEEDENDDGANEEEEDENHE